MHFLREPLVWFVVIALTSLFITYVLFRVLNSTASIGQKTSSVSQRATQKKNGQRLQISNSTRSFSKHFLLTGGVAGFLFIFFASWYTFTPMLKVPIGELTPTSIPDGYKRFSGPGFAIAVPQDFSHPEQKLEIRLRAQDRDSGIAIGISDEVPLERFTSFKPEEVLNEMFGETWNKFMPFMKASGPYQDAPVQGRRGYIIPVQFSLPDDPAFGSDRGKNERSLFHMILDDRSRRLLVFIYDDSEEGRRIMSTLKLPND